MKDNLYKKYNQPCDVGGQKKIIKVKSLERNQSEWEGHLKPVCVCVLVRVRPLIHAPSFSVYNECRRHPFHALCISSKIICNANTANWLPLNWTALVVSHLSDNLVREMNSQSWQRSDLKQWRLNMILFSSLFFKAYCIFIGSILFYLQSAIELLRDK